MRADTIVAIVLTVIMAVFLGIAISGLVIPLTEPRPEVIVVGDGVSKRNSSLAELPPVSATTLRIVNMFGLPLPGIRKKMAAAGASALFDGVDYVFMQELFRTPWYAKDPAEMMRRPDVAVTGVPVTLSVGSVTDSGLAVAATPGRRPASFVAFHRFGTGRGSDALADKGVAVFQLGDNMRVAVTHLQASYRQDGRARHAADEAIRAQQFADAVRFGKAHGAVLLVGDFNTTGDHELTNMLAAQPDVRHVAGDGACTGRALHGPAWWRAAGVHCARLDHVFVLDPASVTVTGPVVTRPDLTEPWSDHAAIDVTVRRIR